jgi:hypothetical protein
MLKQMSVPDSPTCVAVPAGDYEALRLDADCWRRFKTLSMGYFIGHSGVDAEGREWGVNVPERWGCICFDTAEAALTYALGERGKTE